MMIIIHGPLRGAFESVAVNENRQEIHVGVRFSMLKLYCAYAYNILAIWQVCTVGAAAFSMLIHLHPECLPSKVVLLEFTHTLQMLLFRFLWRV